MAIRLKYDAGIAVIPEDKSQQRFGQQLVQHQQKYANDQRQDMQSRAYDQQRLGMQQAAQLNMQNIQGQQALERMNQAQQFGVQQNNAAQAAQMQQRDLGVFDAQLKGVSALAQDAMKNPNVSNDVKRRMQELTIGKGSVNGARFDAQQRQQYLNDYQKEMMGLLDQVKPEDPMHVQANKGLLFRQPNGPYLSPGELAELKRTNPNAEIQTWKGDKMLPPPTPVAPQAPTNAIEFYKQDQQKTGGTAFKKDLAGKMSELQGKIDAGEMKLEDGQDLRSMSWQQMQDDYDFAQKALGGGQSPAGQPSPVQGGQSATPPTPLPPTITPAPTPAIQPADMTPQVVPAATPTAQNAATPALPSSEIKDAEGLQMKDQPIGTRVRKDGKVLIKTSRFGWEEELPGQIDAWLSQQKAEMNAAGGVKPQVSPEYRSQTMNDVAAASAATSNTVPELPDPKAIDDILFPQGVPATTSVAQPQTPAQKTLADAVVDTRQPTSPPASGQPKPLESKDVAPAVDIIGEAIKTFESGTPEQKLALRQKMKSPENISSLEAQAKAGNEDAYKAISALTAEVSPAESVAGAIVAAKKDGKGAVADLQSRKAAGVLTDMSYTAAIIENGKKPAKQVYEEASKTGKSNHAYAEKTALRAIWDEMGMYDEKSMTRAFQADPTKEDIIKHAIMKGKMSREKAEEWFYSQLLGRNYAGWVQKKFEDKLIGNSPDGRIEKQDKKRDAWTPNTK